MTGFYQRFLLIGLFLTPPALSYMDETIQGNEQGYWSHGMMVGQKGEIASRGILFPTHEINFLVGAENYSGVRSYTPLKTMVSTYDSRTFEMLQQMHADDSLVLFYVHPFPLNPFHWTQTKYFVYRAGLAGRKFETTDSFRQFGYRFQEPSYSHHGITESGQKSGKIVHVSRWGLLFGKTCTVYLHEGGTTEVTETKYREMKDWEYNPRTRKNESVIRHEAYDDTRSVPNISLLNIYSESGCRYAEDAALSMAPVSVNYSKKLFEPWHKYKLTIHEIMVSAPGSKGARADTVRR